MKSVARTSLLYPKFLTYRLQLLNIMFLCSKKGLLTHLSRQVLHCIPKVTVKSPEPPICFMSGPIFPLNSALNSRWAPAMISSLISHKKLPSPPLRSSEAYRWGRVLDPALMVTFPPSFPPSNQQASNVERPQDTNLVLTISGRRIGGGRSTKRCSSSRRATPSSLALPK